MEEINKEEKDNKEYPTIFIFMGILLLFFIIDDEIEFVIAPTSNINWLAKFSAEDEINASFVYENQTGLFIYEDLYLDTTPISDIYVPFTGANQDVDLGDNDLSFHDFRFNVVSPLGSFDSEVLSMLNNSRYFVINNSKGFFLWPNFPAGTYTFGCTSTICGFSSAILVQTGLISANNIDSSGYVNASSLCITGDCKSSWNEVSNSTFNQTLTDTLYSDIEWGYNQSDNLGNHILEKDLQLGDNNINGSMFRVQGGDYAPTVLDVFTKPNEFDFHQPSIIRGDNGLQFYENSSGIMQLSIQVNYPDFYTYNDLELVGYKENHISLGGLMSPYINFLPSSKAIIGWYDNTSQFVGGYDLSGINRDLHDLMNTYPEKVIYTWDNDTFNIRRTLNLTEGTGKQVNMSLISPDGTEWNCGVDNSGVFSCS